MEQWACWTGCLGRSTVEDGNRPRPPKDVRSALLDLNATDKPFVVRDAEQGLVACSKAHSAATARRVTRR